MENITRRHNCEKIYKEETEKCLKLFKRFREFWLRSDFCDGIDLLQYGDDDFYFYRFAVSRQEKNTIPMLRSILLQIMSEYNLDYAIPDDYSDAPFEFIVTQDNKRYGITLSEYFADEDIEQLIEVYNLDYIFIAYHWKPEMAKRWLDRENDKYKRNNWRIKAITLKDFFDMFICQEEYERLVYWIGRFVEESKEVIGYKSIKFLSSMNLSAQRAFEKKILATWPYENSKYQIIDRGNKKIQKYLYVEDFNISDSNKQLYENYILSGVYNTMVGHNSFAESFLTSEWLFYSLDGKKNFDYTSVISGYLKSVEQLLLNIALINIDDNCYINVNKDKENINRAIDEGVQFYIVDNKTKLLKRTTVSKKSIPPYPYMEFITKQKKYMDSSIGTFEHFIRNNPHIFIDEKLAEPIADMVSCFRTECRNGYFHTHNLHNWDTVIKTRNNAIYLYYLLLGACKRAKGSQTDLGIIEEDSFDLLCKEIREFRHYNTDFIFEYEDGTQSKMIYDFINNSAEYSDEGIEHYESLLFYKVDDFGAETYEKLGSEIKDEWKYYLTRNSLPQRIYGVHRNKTLQEIYFSE